MASGVAIQNLIPPSDSPGEQLNQYPPLRRRESLRGERGQEISPHEPGVVTDAGEHERDDPYNGPRDSSGPSIRVEEAPPPLRKQLFFATVVVKTSPSLLFHPKKRFG